MRRRRWKSRNPRKTHLKRTFLITMILILLFSMQTFIYIDKNLKPPLIHLASVRMKQIATQSINSAITDRITQGNDLNKLIEWKYDNNGKVSGFMLNYAEHMKITADAINKVQSVLLDLESVPEHIPLGMAMNSAIIASFGPNVPIRMVPQGSVQVELSRRSENVGINMVLVEVYIRVLADVAVIIPFDSEHEIVETEIPISYVLVVGDTPMYYVDSKGNPLGGSAPLPPSVTIPAPPQQVQPGMGTESTPVTPESADKL
ncbi:sporulation protein YunB [Paenibacillus sp. J2TS4]|uniref:sporulation protein YunB n=1 Tax=Paenibacillus sp. J2TS4 TaxID=2807194 RepID=UPI001B1B099B|nr:sporulation protein YunB [Paenibacillus sp. J2TS4]GIP31099.1 sporulation protein YunB [Paenibacillus sp. J2TS4]